MGAGESQRFLANRQRLIQTSSIEQELCQVALKLRLPLRLLQIGVDLDGEANLALPGLPTQPPQGPGMKRGDQRDHARVQVGMRTGAAQERQQAI